MAYFLFPPQSIDTTGLATEANQTLMITELQNIFGEIDQTPVDFIDGAVGPVIDAATNNIPASAALPLEVVNSLAADVNSIQIQDTVGAYIGVYTGAAAAETLLYVGNPGLDQRVPVNIASGTRVSIRNMANVALNLGEYSIQFFG